MPSETERRIADRYELTGLLGRGGMAAVWRALDTRLHREVAVKEVTLPTEVGGDEARSLRRRVEREARAAARLSHPSSVTVFDTFEEDGRLYLVMELVDAPTLHDVVNDRGPFSPPDAARIGLGVLDALEYAHDQGIVHRDVKPANIMVLPDGSVKLADFGIASIKDHPAITRTGQVSGSPSYMAPEQARGGASAAPADLWALGATLYFAVEGTAPFDRDGGAMATMLAVVNEPPRPMRRAGALAPLIDSVLAKDPEARPSLPVVRAALQDAVATERAVETVVAAPPAAPAAAPRRDRRWLAPVIVALLALVVIAVAVLAALAEDDAENDPGLAADESATTSPAPSTSAPPPTTPPTTAQPVAAPPSDRPDGVPDDWVAYRDRAAGYRVWHPAKWEVRRVDATRTDIRDPASGAYLRVDWTDEPGESPEAAWEEQSASFGASHTGYEEIRIEPTTYRGYDAAEWEYTYIDGDARLHAINLGSVTPSRGYALNFQTRDEDWASSQDVFDALKAGFTPAD